MPPMPTELPIACSLSATELPERLAQMSDLGRAALLDVEQSGTQAVMYFRRGAGASAQLAALVVAETRCCAFLDMPLRDDGDLLALNLHPPACPARDPGPLAAAV